MKGYIPMNPWSYPVELLWPDFSAQVFPLPAEPSTCINTLWNQHHSSKPVLNTILPLDCRDSSAASLLLKQWNISQTLQLEVASRGQAFSTFCGSGCPCVSLTCEHLYFGSIDGWAKANRAQLKAPCQPAAITMGLGFDAPQEPFLMSKRPCLPLCLHLQSSLPSVFCLQFCLPGIPLLCFSPVRDPSEEGKETHLSQDIDGQNCLQLPGISILDKLIKTCPVWLQLNMSQERAGVILGKETAGVSPTRFQFRQPRFLSLVVRKVLFIFVFLFI